MSPAAKPGKFLWASLALLGWALGAGAGVALGQQDDSVPPKADPVRVLPAPPDTSQDLLERLGKLEERLDALTRQNEGLWRENQALGEKGGPARKTRPPAPCWAQRRPS
jgi:hypothetical protein